MLLDYSVILRLKISLNSWVGYENYTLGYTEIEGELMKSYRGGVNRGSNKNLIITTS